MWHNIIHLQSKFTCSFSENLNINMSLSRKQFAVRQCTWEVCKVIMNKGTKCLLGELAQYSKWNINSLFALTCTTLPSLQTKHSVEVSKSFPGNL